MIDKYITDISKVIGDPKDHEPSEQDMAVLAYSEKNK